MLVTQETIDLAASTSKMRCYIYRPVSDKTFSAIIFYSEIFQQTAPIARSAAIMASHGFVVIVPEVFHELNPIGTILPYDDAGKDKGNADKFTKTLESHDSDTQIIINYLQKQAFYSGNVGSMGVCIGGHLAFRAALNPSIEAAFCLYPTDIHSNTLPCEAGNDSLTQCGVIKGELCMVFGKQDPHVSADGRDTIRARMQSENLNFSWHEVNAQHAFMRDEGERYDAALALHCYQMAVAMFQRVLR